VINVDAKGKLDLEAGVELVADPEPASRRSSRLRPAGSAAAPRP
jgi:hypothetical protein